MDKVLGTHSSYLATAARHGIGSLEALTCAFAASPGFPKPDRSARHQSADPPEPNRGLPIQLPLTNGQALSRSWLPSHPGAASRRVVYENATSRSVLFKHQIVSIVTLVPVDCFSIFRLAAGGEDSGPM